MSKVLSLFSGIGGFDLPFQNVGHEIVGMCEYDKHAQAVLRYQFPDVPLLDDIRNMDGMEFGAAEIVTFGSPCQNLSVAGRREGLEGKESKLFMQAMRVIQEMREATSGQYPRYALWENVPGALTSQKGHDFRSVLSEILSTEVPMPKSGRWSRAGMVRGGGGSVAWRVLDSQHFGVPQRRKRVFLVADFRGGRAPHILFEPEGVSRNTRESQQEGVFTTNPIEDGIRTNSKEGGQGVVFAPKVSKTINAKNQQFDAGMENLIPIGFNWQNWSNNGLAVTYDGTGPIDTSQVKAVVEPDTLVVRRITPIECERLQGFPDNWTKFGNYGGTIKEIANTHRYKMCGNAVTVNVGEWLANRSWRLRG